MVFISWQKSVLGERFCHHKHFFVYKGFNQAKNVLMLLIKLSLKLFLHNLSSIIKCWQNPGKVAYEYLWPCYKWSLSVNNCEIKRHRDDFSNQIWPKHSTAGDGLEWMWNALPLESNSRCLWLFFSFHFQFTSFMNLFLLCFCFETIRPFRKNLISEK